MPISGVIRETLEREGGSMSGEDDFFSVARTIPFVAIHRVNDRRYTLATEDHEHTFDT